MLNDKIYKDFGFWPEKCKHFFDGVFMQFLLHLRVV